MKKFKKNLISIFSLSITCSTLLLSLTNDNLIINRDYEKVQSIQSNFDLPSTTALLEDEEINHFLDHTFHVTKDLNNDVLSIAYSEEQGILFLTVFENNQWVLKNTITTDYQPTMNFDLKFFEFNSQNSIYLVTELNDLYFGKYDANSSNWNFEKIGSNIKEVQIDNNDNVYVHDNLGVGIFLSNSNERTNANITGVGIANKITMSLDKLEDIIYIYIKGHGVFSNELNPSTFEPLPNYTHGGDFERVLWTNNAGFIYEKLNQEELNYYALDFESNELVQIQQLKTASNSPIIFTTDFLNNVYAVIENANKQSSIYSSANLINWEIIEENLNFQVGEIVTKPLESSIEFGYQTHFFLKKKVNIGGISTYEWSVQYKLSKAVIGWTNAKRAEELVKEHIGQEEYENIEQLIVKFNNNEIQSEFKNLITSYQLVERINFEFREQIVEDQLLYSILPSAILVDNNEIVELLEFNNLKINFLPVITEKEPFLEWWVVIIIVVALILLLIFLVIFILYKRKVLKIQDNNDWKLEIIENESLVDKHLFRMDIAPVQNKLKTKKSLKNRVVWPNDFKNAKKTKTRKK